MLAAAAVGLLFATSAPAADFRTPGRATYCDHVSKGETIEGGIPAPRSSLQCWTPNDGFTTWMSRRSRPRKLYAEQLRRAYAPNTPVLEFGRAWRVVGYRCVSRRTGVTCRNDARHGWWLGRYSGYRLF